MGLEHRSLGHRRAGVAGPPRPPREGSRDLASTEAASGSRGNRRRPGDPGRSCSRPGLVAGGPWKLSGGRREGRARVRDRGWPSHLGSEETEGERSSAGACPVRRRHLGRPRRLVLGTLQGVPDHECSKRQDEASEPAGRLLIRLRCRFVARWFSAGASGLPLSRGAAPRPGESLDGACEPEGANGKDRQRLEARPDLPRDVVVRVRRTALLQRWRGKDHGLQAWRFEGDQPRAGTRDGLPHGRSLKCVTPRAAP